MYYTLFPTELQVVIYTVRFFVQIALHLYALIVQYAEIYQNNKKSLKLLLTNNKNYVIINTTKGKQSYRSFSKLNLLGLGNFSSM